MHCPGSPKSTASPGQAYPSPRSKSPPPLPASKLLWKLHGIRYPLADITNFTIAQAEPDITPFTPAEEFPEGPRQTKEVLCDAPPRSGRGKDRQGRPRGSPSRDLGVGGKGLLRSPIPLVSLSPQAFSHVAFNFRLPILGPTLPPSSSWTPVATPLEPPEPRTPPRTFTPDALAEATKHTLKWTQRRLLAIVRSPPPSPRPASRRSFRTRNYFTRSPSTPSYSDPPAHSDLNPEEDSYIKQFPSLLDPRETQGRRKRTKRELAELQWQVTIHRSLAWRIRMESKTEDCRGYVSNDDAWGECLNEQKEAVRSERAREALGLGQGGLMIAFELMENGQFEEGISARVKHSAAKSHWTDPLDRQLVKRLWEKLITQGCKSVVGSTHVPMPATDTVPFPISEPYQAPGIPFPSSESESQCILAPPIQLFSPPGLESCERRSSPRRRVSAIAFSPRKDSRPALDVSVFPQPPTTRVIPTLPSLPVSTQRPVPASTLVPPPQGTLAPAQLVAQIMLRRGQARTKPIKRVQTQAQELKRSSLSDFVVASEE